MIQEWNERIPLPNEEVAEQCRIYVDNLTKPLGSLADLETIAVRLAAIKGVVKPTSLQKALVVMAADAAIDSPENKTHGATSMAELLLIANGCAPVSAVARQLNMPVFVADVGLEQESEGIPGCMLHKVMNGSYLPGKREAMTTEACAEAIAFGTAMAQELADAGYEVVGIGQIGERAALSALAVTAAFMGPDLAAEIERFGAVPEGEDWHLAEREPETVLVRHGCGSIVALVGLILGLAARGVAIVFDDTVTGAAVLAAVRIAPRVSHYIFSSTYSEDPLHHLQMSALGMKGALHYDLTMSQGLGSALGLSIVDAALYMLNEMKTFGSAGVAVAEDGPGKDRQREDVK